MHTILTCDTDAQAHKHTPGRWWHLSEMAAPRTTPEVRHLEGEWQTELKVWQWFGGWIRLLPTVGGSLTWAPSNTPPPRLHPPLGPGRLVYEFAQGRKNSRPSSSSSSSLPIQRFPSQQVLALLACLQVHSFTFAITVLVLVPTNVSGFKSGFMSKVSGMVNSLQRQPEGF